MAEPKPTKSKMDIAREFKAKEKNIYAEAKEEALAVINEQLEGLKDLGFHYELVEAGETPKPKTATPAKPKDPNKPCSYCGQPGHDARKHRAEILAKKAASDKAS